MTDFLRRLFFVRKCILCGEVLAGEGDAVFCEKCRLEYEKRGRIPCGVGGKKQTLCRCMPEVCRGAVTCAVHLFEYDDEISRRVVSLLKKKDLRVLQDFLVRELSAAVKGVIGTRLSRFSVTFAPRAPKSIRVYGFDQAQLLCEGISSTLGIPMTELFCHARRLGEQKLLSSDKRAENAEKSYALRRGWTRKSEGLILVDDVITTGSTAARLARLAREAGYSEIVVATVARTPYRKNEQKVRNENAAPEKKPEKQADEL